MSNGKNTNVTRKMIVKRVSDKIKRRYPQVVIGYILKALWDVIIEILLEGKTLYIHEKFSISTVFVDEKGNNYNPVTGEYITVPAHYKLKISPHQPLKDILNSNYINECKEYKNR